MNLVVGGVLLDPYRIGYGLTDCNLRFQVVGDQGVICLQSCTEVLGLKATP